MPSEIVSYLHSNVNSFPYVKLVTRSHLIVIYCELSALVVAPNHFALNSSRVEEAVVAARKA